MLRSGRDVMEHRDIRCGACARYTRVTSRPVVDEHVVCARCARLPTVQSADPTRPLVVGSGPQDALQRVRAA